MPLGNIRFAYPGAYESRSACKLLFSLFSPSGCGENNSFSPWDFVKERARYEPWVSLNRSVDKENGHEVLFVVNFMPVLFIFSRFRGIPIITYVAGDRPFPIAIKKHCYMLSGPMPLFFVR